MWPIQFAFRLRMLQMLTTKNSFLKSRLWKFLKKTKKIFNKLKKNIQQKLSKFAQTKQILNHTFIPTCVQICSRIEVYNALALPIMLHGSQIWTFRHKGGGGGGRFTSIEMQFFRRTARYTLSDHKMTEEVLEELKMEPVDEKLRQKLNWLRHVTRMNSSWVEKIVLNCRPNGRRRIGRALKRLLDEAVTGLSTGDEWRRRRWWWGWGGGGGRKGSTFGKPRQSFHCYEQQASCRFLRKGSWTPSRPRCLYHKRNKFGKCWVMESVWKMTRILTLQSSDSCQLRPSASLQARYIDQYGLISLN